MQLIELPPWRPYLAKALNRNRKQPHCRFLQLATLRQDGSPANRTVVFRGFFDNALQIITDTRSEKVNQLFVNPQAEACWYFTKTREQFRIGGTLTIIQGNSTQSADQAIRMDLWQRLSEAARSQFSWPSPGVARNPQDKLIHPQPQDNVIHKASDEAQGAKQASATPPPSTFTVLHLWPQRVDYLMLRGNPQNRYLYLKEPDGQWSKSEINP